MKPRTVRFQLEDEIEDEDHHQIDLPEEDELDLEFQMDHDVCGGYEESDGEHDGDYEDQQEEELFQDEDRDYQEGYQEAIQEEPEAETDTATECEEENCDESSLDEDEKIDMNNPAALKALMDKLFNENLWLEKRIAEERQKAEEHEARRKRIRQDIKALAESDELKDRAIKALEDQKAILIPHISMMKASNAKLQRDVEEMKIKVQKAEENADKMREALVKMRQEILASYKECQENLDRDLERLAAEEKGSKGAAGGDGQKTDSAKKREIQFTREELTARVDPILKRFMSQSF